MPRRFDELGVRLLGETLDRARSVVVSSRQAADIVRRLRPDGPPLLVLPLGHPGRWRRPPEHAAARRHRRGRLAGGEQVAGTGDRRPARASPTTRSPSRSSARRQVTQLIEVGGTRRSPLTSPIGSRSPADSTTTTMPPVARRPDRSPAPHERPWRDVGGDHRPRRPRHPDGHDARRRQAHHPLG